MLSRANNLSVLFGVALAGWTETHWAVTVTIQVSASCLIGLKIWTVRNRTHATNYGSISRSMPIVWIILESGAILSISTVLLLAFYATNKVAGGLVAAINGQLGVISFAVTVLVRFLTWYFACL